MDVQGEGSSTEDRRRTKADFRFSGARLCFGFAGTLGDRGKAVRYERLTEPSDLGRWCVESGCAESPPTCDTKDLARAKVLREAIQRAGEAMANSKSLSPRDIDIINHFAAQPSGVPRLSADGASVQWISERLDAVLSMVARDLIEVCGSNYRDRVRICGNADCGVPFVDSSRAGARRWCSMTTCGGLAKKRKYRAKSRGEQVS